MVRFCLLFCGVILTAGIGFADWRQVQSLDAGTPILVRSGFVADAGKLVRSTPDSVLIDTRTGQVTVAKDDIDEVIVFRSRSARIRRGALAGGVAAGATAAVAFPLFSTFQHSNIAAPTIMTAVNGFSLGFGGYMGGKTKRIYRRSK
jgi:hypothetical protein